MNTKILASSQEETDSADFDRELAEHTIRQLLDRLDNGQLEGIWQTIENMLQARVAGPAGPSPARVAELLPLACRCWKCDAEIDWFDGGLCQLCAMELRDGI